MAPNPARATVPVGDRVVHVPPVYRQSAEIAELRAEIRRLDAQIAALSERIKP